MYIPEFWAGVFLTILSELVGLFIYAIFYSRRKK